MAKEAGREEKSGLIQKILTGVSILLCIVFSFMLICNMTIIIKGTLYPERPPSVLGITPMVVLSGSMSGDAEDHIEVGDLIFVGKTEAEELEVGDVIAFMEGKVVVTHRIIDLFTTLYEEDGQNTETDVAGTSLIAPGTGGSFDLDVKNLSEVNAKYDIAFTIENTSSIPLEFSTDGGTTWSFAIADVNVSGKEINMGATDATTTTVMWRWAFNDVPNYKSDATDTALGIAAQTAAPTVTVTATITAYQVD